MERRRRWPRDLATQEAEPAVDVVPLAQEKQAEDEKAPVTDEYLPTEQEVQAARPLVAAYLPATQFVHADAPVEDP